MSYTLILLKANMVLIVSLCMVQLACSPKIDVKPSGTWEHFHSNDFSHPIHRIYHIGNTIWVSDYGTGQVYFSNDDGKSWNRSIQSGSEYVESIVFPSDEIGYLSGDYGYVYKTENGGRQWKDISPKIDFRITERFREDSTQNQSPDGLFIAYYDMCFITEDKGYVQGYSYNPKIGFQGSYSRLMFETEDGGKNWKSVSNEEAGSTQIGYLQQLNRNNLSRGSYYYFSPDKYLKVTRNKIREDIVVLTPGPNLSKDTAVLQKSPFDRVILRKTIFINPLEGYILGGSLDGTDKAVIYKSVDGGKSWSYLPSDFPHIHDARIIDDHFWIVGKERLIARTPLGRDLFGSSIGTNDRL